jgi:(1->4)-alpha-D-glucan 1-alpha-D-glucosylmutase
MDKALKEAKLNTSWANPHDEYDRAAADFVRKLLNVQSSSAFLQDLDAFVRIIADAGWINSLGQCVLKCSAPGCPDFYQGSELWDFHLVDPDNRGPVDFSRRCRMLMELRQRAEGELPALAADMLSSWPDERVKLFVVWRSLAFRHEHAGLFQNGGYVPLAVEGPQSEHVCAFAREEGGQWVLAVVPRVILPACRGRTAVAAGKSVGQSLFGPNGEFTSCWGELRLELPADAPTLWKHVLAGAEYSSMKPGNNRHFLDLARVFQDFPVAILEGKQR